MPTKKRVTFTDHDGVPYGISPASVEEISYTVKQSLPDEEDYVQDASSATLGSFSDPVQRPPPCVPPRVAYCSDGTPLHVAPTSPVRKKISALQDRRVNTILLEALQLVDCSREELVIIEKSVKKLRDAIYGFSILVDKQVNIIGAENLDERGRVRADIQDLAENLRLSQEVMESTCDRVRLTLTTGKQQIQSHKKRILSSSPASLQPRGSGSESPTSPSKRSGGTLITQTPAASPSIADGGLSFSPAGGRVPLLPLLDCQPSEARQNDEDNESGVPVFMTIEFFASLVKAVGLDEKEFMDQKELVRFAQEMLTFSIAKSRRLTFMGKAFHRRLIPIYARDLVSMIARDLQIPLTPTAIAVVPSNTFFDYMCQPPHSFDRLVDRLYVVDANQYTGEPSPVAPPKANPFSDHISPNGSVLHGGPIVQTLLMNRPDAQRFETAEQTLAMAKLLHDLSTAENEAKHGSRISIRAQPTRTDAFSKVYLATSKELLSKETGIH